MPVSRRVLFLDIDGVLNHQGSPGWHDTDRQGAVLDPDCLEQLRRILRSVDSIDVVVSSTWRRSPEKLRHLGRALRRELDATPIGDDNPRSDHIKAWLMQAAAAGPIASAAILDDDADADTGNGWFFQTSFHAGGLTAAIADRVIAHLSA